MVLNDQNELLDYKFKDRLRINDKSTENNTKSKLSSASFITMMQQYQNLNASFDSFQVTRLDVYGNVLVRRLAIPPSGSEILKLLLDDEDKENNPKYLGIMPNIQAQFVIQGIGGLRTFMMFLVKNLPAPYSHKNIVFRIIDLTETLDGGKWVTTITAGLLPLREQIKKRLGLVGEK